MNPWILGQNISRMEYHYYYLNSSLALNPWIEIPSATPVTTMLFTMQPQCTATVATNNAKFFFALLTGFPYELSVSL